MDAVHLHHRRHAVPERQKRPSDTWNLSAARPAKPRSMTTTSSIPTPRARCSSQAQRERAGAGRRGQAHRARGALHRTRGHVRRRQVLSRGQERPQGREGCKGCYNLDEFGDIIATSRNYDELTDAWIGWHRSRRRCARSTRASSSSPTRARASSASTDLGEMWRSVTTCRPASSRRKPSACGTRSSRSTRTALLRARPAAEEVRRGQGAGRQPIPAHLLGNMWAQEWADIYAPARAVSRRPAST